MNLRRIKRILEKTLGQYDFSVEIKDHSVTAEADLSLKPYNGDILAVFDITDTGFATLDFFFDDIERNARVMQLINIFNDECMVYTAYIDSDGGFNVKHCVPVVDEEKVAEFAENMITYIVNDNVVKYLQPITNYIEE